MGTYAIPNSNACGVCHFSCKKCTGPNDDNCSECQINRTKNNFNQCPCNPRFFEPSEFGQL